MANFDIASVDANLAVAEKLDTPDLQLYDVRKPPFQIYGLYSPRTRSAFRRMPENVAASVSEGVLKLHTHTAGGRVRFSTDSPYVVIKAIMPSITHFAHMPLTGTSGFDLYIDSPDGRQSIYYKTFVPPYHMTDGYESKHVFAEGGTHYVTINFPLYNALTDLYIGVAKDATLGEGAPYRDLPPVVYYGSSITQGGCASRPGNAYQAMVARELQLDFVNLGFSGCGKAEEPMVRYLADMRMSAFVSDYDHNAPNVAYLRDTHQKMYDMIREKNPDLPYVMISRPDYFHNERDSISRRQVVVDTYHYAIAKGDRNVYYIDGGSIFRGPFEDCCAVDGCHPSDLGFSKMAEAVTAILKRALRDGKLLK